MPKLSDTQAILLTCAAQRTDGSIYPLPSAVTAVAVPKSLTVLCKRGLVEERETADAAASHRSEGDTRFGMFVTAAGLASIGIEQHQPAGPAIPAPPTVSRQTKAETIVGLLQRDGGATLAELIAATSWLPHTTRAALTGLRKKGRTIERSKRDTETCYRIVA